ncbi:MAG: ASCH domain-containing protein [Pseudomonadota bacterium]|nr:ASCH domain-containing protein [Pseudomonadota bacterium]
MSVQTKYYNLLKTGSKTIELRLFDEKRQQIKVGHNITFSNSSNATDSFEAEVVALHKAPTFTELFSTIDVNVTGESHAETMVNVLEEFYPREKQLEHSVVGIEVRRL